MPPLRAAHDLPQVQRVTLDRQVRRGRHLHAYTQPLLGSRPVGRWRLARVVSTTQEPHPREAARGYAAGTMGASPTPACN
jgi:hypothetical protein